MKLKLTAIFAAAVLLIFGTVAAHAAVYTVEKPTNGDTVYIAGDPDMYPIEYYDARAKEYKGILPELYKKISDLTFPISIPAPSNDQYRLAKNKQVEIVSAHARGDVDYLSSEVHILTYHNGDEEVELCVGFTSIASDDLVNTVTSALQSASSEQILRLAVETAVNNSPNDFPFGCCLSRAAWCLVAVLTVISHHAPQKGKAGKEKPAGRPGHRHRQQPVF